MGSEKYQELPVSDSSDKASSMTRKGAYAAISYMASAVLLIMFNKAAFSSYKFPCANVITLLQILSSLILLYAMKCWKIISFTSEPQSTTKNPTTLVPFKTLVHTLPLAISYLLYMLVTMESVRVINVPMYTTLRRTTVAFTMIMEYFLTGQQHSYSVVGSVGIIVLGAIVAGARDLSFDAYGYAVVFIANICTAVYLASIARIGKSSGLNTFGLMWCNGIICGPFLLFWTSIRGEIALTINFPYLFSPGFQVFPILGHCYYYSLFVLYWLLNFSIMPYLHLNCISSLYLLQDLLTIGLGWLIFGGLPFDLLNVVGQSLGFLGSCLYAYCKLRGK
ncbi:hypothetical protein FEM48_Zijuj01G0189700 [Ziziphus jujuba var. spinosa]|uniref:Sugar phosphate transporter domain-containing protein n=1 Tax=Ziziphus jujuba var. spinosa TaxID=714518 RepID=A0A978W2Z9_ZIZJJ|nr:hypothetical protein FEM48_Zijuj01G0189700 [Ziziphus jujuba var. spinosa]